MRLTVDGHLIEARPGTRAEIPLLMSFIHAMAAYEKLAVAATAASLEAALFGDRPAAHVLFILADGQPIGYVTYCFTFATMVGKRGLWLDDLYVAPAFRGRGIGRAVMAHLAEVALQHQCGRFEWLVLDWNAPALGFYQKLGATVLAEWRICRLDEAQLAGLAGRPTDTE